MNNKGLLQIKLDTTCSKQTIILKIYLKTCHVYAVTIPKPEKVTVGG